MYIYSPLQDKYIYIHIYIYIYIYSPLQDFRIEKKSLVGGKTSIYMYTYIYTYIYIVHY
jgi:hypothetical protein